VLITLSIALERRFDCMLRRDLDLRVRMMVMLLRMLRMLRIVILCVVSRRRLWRRIGIDWRWIMLIGRV
jgi:hypothetical protein